MKLSILVATQGCRNDKFKELLKDLHAQAGRFSGMVEVVAYWNNGELSIGEIRQELLNQSQGEYVCFVDDDDEVPDYYCQEILANLGRDYVGFRVQLYNDGKLMPPVYHSLKHTEWRADYDGYYRDITHLNPIRREIAVQGKFSLNGAGEDSSWADTVRSMVKSESYINRVMYMYRHSSTDTSFGSVEKLDNHVYKRPEVDYKHFRYITKGV